MTSVDEINLMQAQNEALIKQNKELQQENRRLKNEYDILDGIIDLYNAKIGQLKKEIKELAHYLACMTEQRNKANTSLQEIKEIISNIIDGYIRPYGDYEQLKNILDIINKAEV